MTCPIHLGFATPCRACAVVHDAGAERLRALTLREAPTNYAGRVSNVVNSPAKKAARRRYRERQRALKERRTA